MQQLNKKNKSPEILFKIASGLVWNVIAIAIMVVVKEDFNADGFELRRDIAQVIEEPFKSIKTNHYFYLLTMFYGILGASHFIIQYICAAIFYFKVHSVKEKYSITSIEHITAVVIIPSFNENPSILRGCIQSCFDSGFSGKLIISIVDDRSNRNCKSLNKVYDWAKSLGAQVFMKTKNEGKRRAQHDVFSYYGKTIDYYITIDSDTIIEADCFNKLVLTMENDLTLGACTGEVLALNDNKNILTMLINCRYWLAFNIERASQALFRSVTCCSGPLSIYRAGIINNIKEKYISQFFLGVECTYGDDRHLTNLVLGEGFRVTYNPHAKALTDVPDNIINYCKQQLRWSKSFYREIFYTPFEKANSLYMFFDVCCQALLPVLFSLCLGATIYDVYHESVSNLAPFLWWFLLMSVIRSGPGVCWSGDKRFIFFPLYGILHMFFLLPIRYYALVTLRISAWGTR